MRLTDGGVLNLQHENYGNEIISFRLFVHVIPVAWFCKPRSGCQ